MSYLFVVENRIVKPNTETLMVPVFRAIWERDTNPGKFTAMDEFAYIEFMVSVKRTNPYRGYNVAERIKRLNKDVMKHEDYVPDEFVRDAMTWLTDHQLKSSKSLSYYNSAIKALDKIQNFFDTFDMTSLNPKTGNPLYKPKDITSAVIDTENALQKLSAIDEKVQNEIFETQKTKGDKTVSRFSDPSTL